MPRITRNYRSGETDQPSRDADFLDLVSQMTCACAETSAPADAPIARALFHNVETLKQPLKVAAGALGIGSGDAAYLLTGLREDVAEDLVDLLAATHATPGAAFKKDVGDE